MSADRDIERLFQKSFTIPIKVGDRVSSLPGKTTGLSINPFLYQVFKHQEEIGQDKKVTDDHILEMVRLEFGQRSIVYEDFLAKKRKVYYVRAKYNRTKPPLLSLAYNLAGFPKIGINQLVSLKDVRRKCFYYRLVDPRFFTPSEIATISSFIVRGLEAYAGFRLPTTTMMEMYPYGSIQFMDADTIGLQHLEREVGKNGST